MQPILVSRRLLTRCTVRQCDELWIRWSPTGIADLLTDFYYESKYAVKSGRGGCSYSFFPINFLPHHFNTSANYPLGIWSLTSISSHDIYRECYWCRLLLLSLMYNKVKQLKISLLWSSHEC